MNQRIIPIKESVHDQVQKLLPWFVNDTLTGAEQAMVNQHLNVCPDCQADFAWQCKLRSIAPAAASEPNVDRAYASLQNRISAQHKATTRHRSLWQLFSNRSWMPWALAAQCAAILVLVVLVATPYGDVAPYHALGSDKNSNGNMVVVFKPDTSEREIRRALNQAGARIVDGPTVTDAYMLNVPEENLASALDSLRTGQGVQMAEPLKGKP